MQEMVKYCPRCGWVEKGRGIKECWFCHIEMKDTELSYDDKDKMSEGDYIYWRQTYPRQHIIPSDRNAESQRLATWLKLQAEGRLSEIGQGNGYFKSEQPIRCPHCGYDKFQMVSRKWSLLTGILTNKVDRVCERCKKRF